MKKSISFLLAIIMLLSAFPLTGFVDILPEANAADKPKLARVYFGDINENGKIEAADARLILRYSVGLQSFSDRLKEIADCNADSKITAADARIVLRASVGLQITGSFENYAAYNDSYVIGLSGPLTGSAASYGVDVLQGAELAVSEINNAGGLNGVNFTILMQNDRATSTGAINCYNDLYKLGMQVSLCSVTSNAATAFAEAASADGMFTLTPTASADSVIRTGEFSYRCCFGDSDQGTMVAQKLAAEYKNIGVIYDISDPYSLGIYEAFSKEMKKLGKDFSEQVFDCDNNRDFYMQAKALKNCDVIFLPVYYMEAWLIENACYRCGCHADLFGCDGLSGIESMPDDSRVNRISYITSFDVKSSNIKVSQFVKNYSDRYKEKPNQFAADAYDAVYAIYYAMKTAGVNNPRISPYELALELQKVFNSEVFRVPGVTGTISWNEDGSCNKSMLIVNVN